MPQSLADYARERDNDSRAAAGKKADASAGSKINVGDLGAAARAAAAKKAKIVTPTAPKAMKKGGVVRGMSSRKC